MRTKIHDLPGFQPTIIFFPVGKAVRSNVKHFEASGFAPKTACRLILTGAGRGIIAFGCRGSNGFRAVCMNTCVPPHAGSEVRGLS